MNQRDQNQTSGRRGGRQETSGRQGQGGRSGRSQQDDERYGGRGTSSAGQRFGDTYNPEPQWLRDDRERGGQASQAREDDDYRTDYHGSNYSSYGEGEYTGRGSYAGAGRPWGEEGRGFRSDLGGYGNEYPGRTGYGMGEHREHRERGYGERSLGERGYGERSFGERDYGERGFGERGFGERSERGHQSSQRYAGSPGSRAYGRDLGGRDIQSGYGAQSRSYGGGLHEYGTPGYETAGYDRDTGYSGGSMTGSGYGSQYRAGSESGYGSRSGYQLGSHQTDTGYQRSYRGMGPQSYRRPDDRIRDDIYERLTDNDRIDARNIMVDVNQGNVTLTGAVPERQMRYAAEDLVESCMGVSNINNQLKVQQDMSSGTGLPGSSTGSTSAGSTSASGTTGAAGSSATGSTDAKH